MSNPNNQANPFRSPYLMSAASSLSPADQATQLDQNLNQIGSNLKTLSLTSAGPTTQYRVNNTGAVLVIGTPVYADSATTVNLAKSDAVGTVEVIGLAQASRLIIAAGGQIQCDGVLQATTIQWDAVAGTTGGLTAGVIYYLSDAVAGQLTSTPPSLAGHFVKQVGIGLSSTNLLLTPSRRVKL